MLKTYPRIKNPNTTPLITKWTEVRKYIYLAFKDLESFEKDFSPGDLLSDNTLRIYGPNSPQGQAHSVVFLKTAIRVWTRNSHKLGPGGPNFDLKWAKKQTELNDVLSIDAFALVLESDGTEREYTVSMAALTKVADGYYWNRYAIPHKFEKVT
jgi:hypothetical protein